MSGIGGILDMKWLEGVGETVIDWRKGRVQLIGMGCTVNLQGLLPPSGPEFNPQLSANPNGKKCGQISLLPADKIFKITKEFILLLRAFGLETSQTMDLQSTRVQQFLDQFPTIVQESTKLPPWRGREHALMLLIGNIMVKVRPISLIRDSALFSLVYLLVLTVGEEYKSEAEEVIAQVGKMDDEISAPFGLSSNSVNILGVTWPEDWGDPCFYRKSKTIHLQHDGRLKVLHSFPPFDHISSQDIQQVKTIALLTQGRMIFFKDVDNNIFCTLVCLVILRWVEIDVKLMAIITASRLGETSKEDFTIEHNRLLLKRQLVLSTSSPNAQNLLRKIQGGLTSGQTGLKNTYMRICQELFWFSLWHVLANFMTDYEVCKLKKTWNLAPACLLHFFPIPDNNWEDMSNLVFHDSCLKLPLGDLADVSPISLDIVEQFTRPVQLNFMGEAVALLSAVQVLLKWNNTLATEVTWATFAGLNENFPSFDLEDKVVSWARGNDMPPDTCCKKKKEKKA